MPLPVGFFAPLAVPAMGAYLVWQNANMATAFGMHMKKGERRIGAMHNDAFLEKNQVTTEQSLIQSQLRDMKAWTAAMPAFFEVARALNIEVIGEFARFFQSAFVALGQLVSGQVVSGEINVKTNNFPTIPGITGPLLPEASAYRTETKEAKKQAAGDLTDYSNVYAEKGTTTLSPKPIPKTLLGASLQYYRSIKTMSAQGVQIQLKLYAQKKLPKSVQIPQVGAELLRRYNEIKNRPATSKYHSPQTFTRNDIPWNTRHIITVRFTSKSSRTTDNLRLALQVMYAQVLKKYKSWGLRKNEIKMTKRHRLVSTKGKKSKTFDYYLSRNG